MEPYAYPPLSPGQIRLVVFTIDPATSTLSASIENVPFDQDDPITYTALSYVWGDPAFTVPLVVNNAVLHITPTLSTALRNITVLHPSTPLWIDQICINQADTAERSSQVKLMNAVFNRASKVLAYLGPATPSTALAASLVTRVGALATEKTGDMFLWDSEQYHPESLKKYETLSEEDSLALGVPFSDTASWDAFSELYDNPWYERIWIVQEVLPARNAVVICGEHELQWVHVKHAAIWYHFKAEAVRKRHRRKVDGVALTCGMDLPWNVRMGTEYLKDLMGQKTGPTYKWELLHLLRAFRGRKATEPRDKVFALLGLSTEGIDGKYEEYVDYGRDIKEIFAETARRVIARAMGRGKLDVLFDARRSTCRCVGCEVEDGWPTWVPDWRRHFGDGCEWGVGKDFQEWHVDYQCGEYEAEEGGRSLELQVKGFVIGTVTYRSPWSHFQEIIVDGHMREARDICLDMVGETYPTGENTEEVVAMTFVGGQLPKPIADKGTEVGAFAENYLLFLDGLLMPRETPEEIKARSDHTRPYHDKYGFSNDWLEAVLKAYCERRLFVLDSGHIGLGNHHMEEGDVVVKLAGMSMPCVLRPGIEEGEYEFVGEAYCYGQMEGLSEVQKGQMERMVLV